MKKIEANEGITLVVVVITVIVMLILATITIGAINNGLFENAGQAKLKTESQSEAQGILSAYAIAKDVSKTNKISESDLQKQLDKEFGDNYAKVYKAENGFEVFITGTNKYFEVDNNTITEKECKKDSKPANFYCDNEGNDVDGSASHPYEISCIEDLVVLSNLTRGVGNYINSQGNITSITAKNSFSGKYFIFTKTLDFNSPASYGDLSIKWSYDSEAVAYVVDAESQTNLKDIITDKNGVGFVPIGGYIQKPFSGIVDGQGFEIQNIYENRNGIIALIAYFCGTLKNLGIQGEYKGTSGAAFSRDNNDSKYYNCYSKVNIVANTDASGIAHAGSVTFINCYNEGKLIGTNGEASGIMLIPNGGTTIINSYNKGELSGKLSASNVIGTRYTGKSANIKNTCALGRILTNVKAHTFYCIAYEGVVPVMESCFYLSSIIEENPNVIADDGGTAITNLSTALTALNTYVNAHKNDYAVPLKEWEIRNGELAFKN